MSPAVIILGAGGHAKVIIDALHRKSVDIIAIADPDKSHFDELQSTLKLSHKIRYLDCDDIVLKYSTNDVFLVNGLGSINNTRPHKIIYEKFKSFGYSFLNTAHPSAVIASNVQLGEGIQIMAGAIIQSGSRIGRNTIVNTKASIDHDCVIGEHVHISPGVTLCGGVVIGDGVHVGAGATIVQGVEIGRSCLIGAGSLVLKDVSDGSKVFGVPAKKIEC